MVCSTEGIGGQDVDKETVPILPQSPMSPMDTPLDSIISHFPLLKNRGSRQTFLPESSRSNT